MRRSYLNFLFGSAILLCAGMVASAQTGALRGSVKLTAADGTTAPVTGAAIDVYRTDISGDYHTKTDKKGEWVFAGLPYVGDYVVSVSAPGTQPYARGGVKAGRDIPVDVVLNAGDGKKLTRDEAISVAKSGGGGSGGTNSGESATDRAKRAELAKQAAAAAEANKKIENANQIIGDAFKNGNAALTAKNYDEAIKLYDAGLAADPEHPGIPSLLTNKSVALRSRGVDHFNAAVQSKDEAAKTSGTEAAKADFSAAAEAANRAVDLINKQTAPTDPDQLKQFTTNKYFALSARAEAMRLFVSKVDPTKADAAGIAFQEYIAAEPDPAKKTKAQKDYAQMLFETSSDVAGYERAIAEYQKILTANPDDADSLLRVGQALFNIGALNNNDKAKYQEAANYLQKFIDKAPDTNPLKQEAKDLIEALKAQANVTPEKTNTPPRRRRP